MTRTVWALLASLGLLVPAPAEAAEGGRRVALVVGVSTYEHLPSELGPANARADAARVAAALDAAGFDQVRLLTDASATRASLDALGEHADVGPDDLFLLYFAGHGIGGDFGDPRLLLYDADPELLESTTLQVAEVAGMLDRAVGGGRIVVATDAAHPGVLGGNALLGPTGNDWPSLGRQSFVVSSAAPRQVAEPGVFATALVEGLGGAADANADGAVTGSELNGWLQIAVSERTGGRQQPTVQATYAPGLEITRQRRALAAASGGRVDKVKFVLPDGEGHVVECPGAAPVACEPSCYAFDVQAGSCVVSLKQGDRTLVGEAAVTARGLYRCEAIDGALSCAAATRQSSQP